MISKKEQEYLHNKHRGGRNNAKGNQYESFFTVRVLSELLYRYHYNLSSVRLQSQVPETYVDDLLIYEPGKRTYHQIKDVKDLNWKTGKSHTLEYDFRQQRKLCRQRSETFALKLIHSHTTDKVDKVPRGLGKCTSVELFQAVSDLNSLVVSNVKFQNDLRLLLYNGLSLPLDKLSILSSVILGVWMGYPSSSMVNLQLLSQAISRILPDYIGNVSVTISPECEAVFNSIGVSYWISGETVNITWRYLSASFILSSDLQEHIVSANPRTPLELFSLVNM